MCNDQSPPTERLVNTSTPVRAQVARDVFTGNDAVPVFSAIAYASGEVELVRFVPGSWAAALGELARRVRDNFGVIQPGWMAPSSTAVH
jgi:hypothetical protein